MIVMMLVEYVAYTEHGQEYVWRAKRESCLTQIMTLSQYQME